MYQRFKLDDYPYIVKIISIFFKQPKKIEVSEMTTIELTRKSDGKKVTFDDSRYSFYNGFTYIWGTGQNKREKKGRFRSKNWDLTTK